MNAYGESKLAGEMAISSTFTNYCILRTAWVLSHNRANFVTKVLSKARQTNVIHVVNDQVGSPTSSTYVANSTLKCIELDLTGTYHLSCAGYASWADVAEEVLEQAKGNDEVGLSEGCKVKRVPSSDYQTIAKRPLNSKLDCRKWAAVTGAQAPWWRDEVRDIVAKIGEFDS